jgi:hypothetical protein
MSFVLGLIVYALVLGRLDLKLPWPGRAARGGRS